MLVLNRVLRTCQPGQIAIKFLTTILLLRLFKRLGELLNEISEELIIVDIMVDKEAEDVELLSLTIVIEKVAVEGDQIIYNLSKGNVNVHGLSVRSS